MEEYDYYMEIIAGFKKMFKTKSTKEKIEEEEKELKKNRELLSSKHHSFGKTANIASKIGKNKKKLEKLKKKEK